jgi:AcrR family transcriptional regulator
LRQDILDAARDIATQDGWQALTIRKIADRIAYSVPTIYEHFESKEALLVELMRDGFRLLADALREVSPGEDPEARLVAVATAYWDFAFQNPALYQVMHELGGVTFGTPQTPPAALDAFNVLSKAVQAAVPDGARFANLDDEVERLWATLHGFISLTMAGRIKGGKERAAGLVAPSVEQMIAGWRHSISPGE